MDNMEKIVFVIIVVSMTMPTLISGSHPSPYEPETIYLNRNKRGTSTLNNGVVIDCKTFFRSSGIAFNNKIYFGCTDHQLYEYDPVTNQQKVITKARKAINSSGLLFNNKLYFGSDDGKVYEYDFATKQKKDVIKTNGYVYTSGVVLNNKIYFGSADGNLYEYDPESKKQEIRMTTSREIWSSGVVLLNKLYVGSANNQVYEYDPQSDSSQIVIKTNGTVHGDGVVLNNKVYFGSGDNNVYEYDPKTKQQKIVIKTKGDVYTSGVVYNNKLYFGSFDGNIYEYDPKTNQQDIIITTEKSVYTSSGVILNNKLYFGTEGDDGTVYEYNFLSKTLTVLKITGSGIHSRGLKLNNAVYFSSKDGKVYQFIDDSKISKNANLEKCLNDFNTEMNALIKIRDSLKKSNPDINNHCVVTNIKDINELSKFVNNVLSENITGLGQNLQDDKYINMLAIVQENIALKKIKQAGKNIENIEIDVNNIEIVMEEISKNMYSIANSLNEVGDATRPYADVSGLTQITKLLGIIFQKIKEIILNLKYNEKDLFKENIKVLGSGITAIGDKVFNKDSKELGNKMKQVGRDLSESDSEDEYIFENIGNKIEHFGKFLIKLGEIVENIESLTNKTGLVLQNIGFIIKTFITHNFCKDDANSKIAKEENLDLKKQLESCDSKMKDLENKLSIANEKIHTFKRILYLD